MANDSAELGTEMHRCIEHATKAAVLEERERCAKLCEMLADRHQLSADRIRKEGTIEPMLWGKPYVHFKWERAAQGVEACIHSLRTIADCIHEGYDPAKLKEADK